MSVYLSFYASLFKGLASLAFARLYTPQRPSTRDLSGQVAIVTGANSGIGLNIALQLAKQGATVYLACRNLRRGEKAVEEVVAKVGEQSKGRVHCWLLDTSDLNSVRIFCNRWHAEGEKIDMLVHNAGIASPPPNSPSITKDGKSLLYVTNFLGSFLMTHLLESHLSDDARVVLTSSTGHHSAAGTFLRPQKTSPTSPPNLLSHFWNTISTALNLDPSSAPLYGLTKAQQVLFATLLQHRFSSLGQHRTAHAFTPGFTSTPIFGKFDVTWRTWLSNPTFAALKATERYVAVSTEQGAMTGSWLAAGETGGREMNKGGYWEWQERETSLVEFMRESLGEEVWRVRAREEWGRWVGNAGVEWESPV